MKPEEILLSVIGALKEVQKINGRPWIEMDEKSKPIGQLPDFDSPSGLLFTCAIEEAFGIEVPEDENLCVHDLPNGHRRARTLKEILGRLVTLLEPKGKVPK